MFGKRFGVLLVWAATLGTASLSAAFATNPRLLHHRETSSRTTSLASSPDTYLSSLSTPNGSPVAAKPPRLNDAHHKKQPVVSSSDAPVVTFSHAPLSHFAVDKLRPKGPRKNADVGQPHDATLPLVSIGPAAAGSWWCAAGGWPSPALRTTTEVFFVLEGHGCLTDLDGVRHYFGPGDVVILPKNWSGRWDIAEAIHKVWLVHDHPDVEAEKTTPIIRARVAHYAHLFPGDSSSRRSSRPDAVDFGTAPTSKVSHTIYDVGPTEVGSWACTPGTFHVVDKPETEWCHVLEGLFFLTNADGSARRCGPGDTIVFPRGWTGVWDVLEPVRKLWVAVEEKP